MVQKFLHKSAGILFPAFLVLMGVILAWKNYSSGTYLIGWDSIHSEFNFPLNLARMFSRVWSGEMGVGAIAAHSDMSDLPRILILWLSSLVLPASFLRYFYVFTCLVLGPLGIYFFLKYVFGKEGVWPCAAAFLGGTFYLLGLGTVQNFYVPLEMFPTAFAAAPWLMFTGFKYLCGGKKATLIAFVVVTILASLMAYAATQAYAIYVGLFLFFLTFSLIDSERKLKLKRFLILGLLALFMNLYWILPNIYSLLNQSQIITNAQTNRLFSPEAFLRNQEYGDFKDVLIQKSFLFDWRNFDFQTGEFDDLLGAWTKHLGNPTVLFTGFVLVSLSVIGFIIGILKREKVALALIPVLAIVLFFLFNINPPFGRFYAYLYDHFGVFREALRMPFTKFSILFEIVAAFYFGYFFYQIFSFGNRLLAPLKLILLVGVAGGLIYWMQPAFRGQLIGKNVRVNFPDYYFNAFDWFNSKPEGRVALLPINSKYGWEYRDWGYEGSGFLTYGIKQPILYRDFDRWSSYNEDFYNQASSALYGSDPEAFAMALKKYQVKYLLLDESVINPGGNPNILFIPEIKDMISKLGIKEVAKFGFLTIYETNFGSSDEFISAPKTQILNLQAPLIKNELIVNEDLSVNRGFPESYNCDLKRVGTVFKKNSGEGILYKADGGGVSCDYLNYLDLKYTQPYILHVVGENRTGRSLKIYFTNFKTERADLEELMPSGKFDKEFYIYPSKLDGGGYSLNFETRSYGRIASENLLTKVEIYNASFALGWPQVEFAINNDLKINGVHKYGTWAYKVSSEGSGLLELGQGFEPGWIAFSVKDFQFLEHQKLNDWANGWIVPSSSMNESAVYIFYWPQLLEWLGIVVGAVTMGVIWVLPLGSPKSTRKG